MTTRETASQPRQIRVFISSTFRDMHAERDHLVTVIFPQLRRLCDSRGVTWGEVDLRWGVTDEAAAEGKYAGRSPPGVHSPPGDRAAYSRSMPRSASARPGGCPSGLPRAPGFLASLDVDIRTEQGVDAGLVASSAAPEPAEHIGIDAQRDLRLPRDRRESPPDHGPGEHLGRDLRAVGKIDVRVGHRVNPSPVSRRFPRSRFALHFWLPCHASGRSLCAGFVPVECHNTM